MRKYFGIASFLSVLHCSSVGNTPPAPPACDEACHDETAMRAVREMMKLAYNVTLQGQPVGDHDVTVPCPLGGTARVVGNATSNADQGATNVTLDYDFSTCGYVRVDTEPTQNYNITLSGTVHEQGVIAVEPSSTTSLVIDSDAMDISGTVEDPPVPYSETMCPLKLGQNGNALSGMICGRTAGLSL